MCLIFVLVAKKDAGKAFGWDDGPAFSCLLLRGKLCTHNDLYVSTYPVATRKFGFKQPVWYITTRNSTEAPRKLAPQAMCCKTQWGAALLCFSIVFLAKKHATARHRTPPHVPPRATARHRTVGQKCGLFTHRVSRNGCYFADLVASAANSRNFCILVVPAHFWQIFQLERAFVPGLCGFMHIVQMNIGLHV